MNSLKSLNQAELLTYCQSIQEELEQAQLQQIWTTSEQIILEFYKKQTLWLLVDMNWQQPVMVLLHRKPPMPKKTQPLALFMNAHFKNKKLKEVVVQSEWGRVVRLNFAPFYLQIILIPKSPNIIASTGEKKISWYKPKELLPALDKVFPNSITDYREIEKQWWINREREAPRKESPAVESILDKKKKLLETLKKQSESKDDEIWREMGEWLKYQSEVPERLKKYFNPQKSIAWNRENAFKKAKSISEKRQGLLQRVILLGEEIRKIQREGSGGGAPQLGPVPSLVTVKTRKLDLGSGVVALCGKSAKDNLQLLRQSRAWDYWLHLKDYPGAHALIFREKGQSVPREMIEKVAQWLIDESRKIKMVGKFDVVMAECRHVRPIKGDRLGRVTYHHPQVFTFASRS